MGATTVEQVAGDPDKLRSAGRNWGNEAEAYNSQATSLVRVQNSLPPSAFTGARGDQMRAYLADTISTTTALRAAYQQIGNAAPRVAEAIDDAKQALDRRKRAQKGVEAAQHDVDKAQGDVTAATAAVATSLVKDLLGASGAAAATAQHELAAAQRRLEHAQHELADRSRTLRSATDDLADAQHSRTLKTEAFAHLLTSQTAIITRTLPSAPPAPTVSPILSQLTVLGYGRQAIKGLLDLQKNAVRNYYGVPERVSLAELRRIRTESGVSLARTLQIRLTHRGGTFGPLTKGQAGALAQIEKWGGRLKVANNAVALTATFASNTIKVLHDPNLTDQQKQDQIFNRTLLEFGGGYAGGALCAPGGLVASAACGYVGGQAGKLLESSSLVRRATDGYSHIYLNPTIEPVRDLLHGRIGEAAKDAALIPVRVPYNLVTQTFPTPERVGHVLHDAGHDAKGVKDFLDDKAGDFFSGLSRGLRGGH